MGRDGTGRDIFEWDGTGRDENFRDGTGRDEIFLVGTGRDGTKNFGTGRDGMEIFGTGRDEKFRDEMELQIFLRNGFGTGRNEELQDGEGLPFAVISEKNSIWSRVCSTILIWRRRESFGLCVSNNDLATSIVAMSA